MVRSPSIASALLLGAAVVAAAWRPVRADDAPAPVEVEVPDVRQQRLAVAELRLEGAGLRVGPIWRMSWRRLADEYGIEVAVGSVAFQRPRAGIRRARGEAVELILAAAEDGPLPQRLPPPTRTPARDAPPERPAGTPDEASAEAAPPEAPRAGPDAASPTPSPAMPTAERAPAPPPPVAPSPEAQPAAEGESPAAAEGPIADEAPTIVGSPEAPEPAPPADSHIVPPLIGLHLPVAEQLARDAEMHLHVERVPGHPIGRVIRQSPEPYSARPRGGLVKVVITAGGDFAGEVVPPPAVHVDEVDVPSLLDRTEMQAMRILHDLRLVGRANVAERGPTGRIVDQRPRPGERVPVGSLVDIWVAPGDPNVPQTPFGANGESPPVPSSDPSPTPAPAVPSPPPSPAAPAVAPTPIAPLAGTSLPTTATLDVGFMWTPVEGADGYLLDVEEQDADGGWIGVARRRAKRPADTLTIERLDAREARPIRWRVAALVSGRPGPFSAWVTLP